jgi:hypothetical protein
MKIKLICSLLCVMAVLSCTGFAMAASAQSSESTAIQVLGALGIMKSDQSGNLNLQKKVTRAQFAQMLVAASTYKDKVAAVSNSSPFRDVSYKHWAASYIKTAVGQGWISGYVNGTFKPSKNLKLEEAATGALKLLGYATSDFSGSYPYGQISLYKSLGLNKGIKASRGTVMTRRDMVHLFYNLLNTDTKSGGKYIETLGYKVDSSGDIDFISLMMDTMEGPYVLSSSLSDLGIRTTNYKVYRNGRLSSAPSAKKYDVAYYSEGLKTIWIYSNAISGTCQTITKSGSDPTSVTVAGKAYELGTTDAKLAFSTLGGIKTGDVVALLLGRDNEVVAAISSSDYASASSEVCGIVTDVSTATYTNALGHDYTTYEITVVSTDGSKYTYPVDYNSNAGTLVKVAYSDSGMKITWLPSSLISGRVSAAATSIGDAAIASDVEILDVYTSTSGSQSSVSSKRIYAPRLAGLTLSESDVLYCGYNARGEVDRLILDDFTGDLYQYGVITSASEERTTGGNQTSISSSYTYDIGGQSYSLNLDSTILHVSEGPARFRIENGTVDSVRNLTSVSLDSIAGMNGYSSNQPYTLSEDVAVYELRGGDYHYSSLGIAKDGGYTMTGYYDKPESKGGRIRVIVISKEE